MRLALTVASPATRRTADVVVEADPATPVADIAAELQRFISGGEPRLAPPPGSAPAAGAGTALSRSHAQGSLATSSAVPAAALLSVPVYVNCQLIPPELTLAEARIGDGAVVSLGSPEAACPRSKPGWSRSG